MGEGGKKNKIKAERVCGGKCWSEIKERSCKQKTKQQSPSLGADRIPPSDGFVNANRGGSGRPGQHSDKCYLKSLG